MKNQKKNKIYQGSSKILYELEDDYSLIMSFEDTHRITPKDIINIPGKGAINNAISSYLMQKLDMIGITNHLIEKINMKQQMIHFVDVYPVQIHIGTISSGRYVDDFGMEKGYVFDDPLIDFRIKNSDLGYPVINEDQIIKFQWLNKKELEAMKKQALRIHDFLSGIFSTANIRLVSVKLEFGRIFDGDGFVISLVDEISPDNCLLWDMKDNRSLCYEIIPDNRHDTNSIIKNYQEVLNRITAV